jgi:hypothetical protein
MPEDDDQAGGRRSALARLAAAPSLTRPDRAACGGADRAACGGSSSPPGTRPRRPAQAPRRAGGGSAAARRISRTLDSVIAGKSGYKS